MEYVFKVTKTIVIDDSLLKNVTNLDDAWEKLHAGWGIEKDSVATFVEQD